MNEHQIELIEDLFKDGCIIIYRNSKRDNNESDSYGIYVSNPKQCGSLEEISALIVKQFEDEDITPDQEDIDDNEEEDQEE
jgi:hypothetical protein